MQAEQLSFDGWKRLAHEDPERLADMFLGKYGLLTPESQRAFIASHPGRDIILQNIKTACSAPERPLSGVPYILQDMFDLRGLPTRCGAPIAEPFEAPLEESSLLAQTLNNQGAAFLAKTVPSEFGWDMRGHNHTFGDCPHANALKYICGGGAGASAHAVSNNWAPIAFGLDSCAGIRIPAAFHGLFGFRMETNAFARDGVFPIIPSLESVGWVTAHLEDLESSFCAFYQPKPDSTREELRGYLHGDSLQLLAPETKTGLMELVRPLDIDDEPAVNKMLSESFEGAPKAFRTIESRELYSIHQYWIEEYKAYYDPRLLKRIEAGLTCTAAESEEATTTQQNLRATLISFFRDYDYLILPISPLPTPEKTEWDNALEDELVQFNAPVSLALLPALIMPFRSGEEVHSAAQFVFNPRKLHLVPELLSKLRGYYA